MHGFLQNLARLLQSAYAKGEDLELYFGYMDQIRSSLLERRTDSLIRTLSEIENSNNPTLICDAVVLRIATEQFYT